MLIPCLLLGPRLRARDGQVRAAAPPLWGPGGGLQRHHVEQQAQLAPRENQRGGS